jgi:hypothetical protein
MVSEHGASIPDFLHDVHYNRACGRILTITSGTDPSYSLTLIADVASYFTLFKDFRTLNKREGWWISDSYILAFAQNMKRIGNLFASHLQDSCEREQPREDSTTYAASYQSSSTTCRVKT